MSTVRHAPVQGPVPACLDACDEGEGTADVHLLHKDGRRVSVNIRITQLRNEEFKRCGWPYGLVFIDIDHFKCIKDECG
jgi:GGDEF domain-containing protein